MVLALRVVFVPGAESKSIDPFSLPSGDRRSLARADAGCLVVGLDGHGGQAGVVCCALSASEVSFGECVPGLEHYVEQSRVGQGHSGDASMPCWGKLVR